MAAEMHRQYVRSMEASHARSAARPRELQELDARLDRLRERLRAGDPDMKPDEIRGAIERAEQKRQELADYSPNTG
ncbi:MAG TPA: hypothetical protein VGD45_33380 [Steroidobacter sp.]|uniref:hypothetical protein n=1 Tax=Steroidobacter sp. TaxID=1978227 RepID=UPI002EDA9E70